MASRYFPLYNIDQPVGPGKANKPDDVRLVQALFIELSRFDQADWFARIPPDQRSLATTGMFDATLEKWILAFQNFYVENLGGVKYWKADGVIDPMPLAGPVSASSQFKSGRYSTLSMMCNRLWKWNRSAYLKVGDDYRVPWIPSEHWGT